MPSQGVTVMCSQQSHRDLKVDLSVQRESTTTKQETERCKVCKCNTHQNGT